MIVGITMVRDEADIIAPILGHLLAEGLDHLIVADNLSTDGTRAILDALALADRRITVLDDSDPAHWQGRKMTGLARRAGAMGAEWVVPFDADELWYSPDGPLADYLRVQAADVVFAQTYEHVPHPDDDPGEKDPVRRIQHRRMDPKPARKVCFRFHPEARLWDGNHMVSRPGRVAEGAPLRIREFQYRSLAQTTRKVRNGKAALEATTLPASEGSHWRDLGGLSEDQLAAWWAGHLSEAPLVFDPAPVRCPALPQ